jgi:hypothetical protein
MEALEVTMEENRIVIEFENSESPEELAAARRQREQFDRNSAWLQAHILEIGDNCRGKCICIAGQQLFVGDTAREAVAQATAAHPEDKGWFTRYIPREKVARIYQTSASLAATF